MMIGSNKKDNLSVFLGILLFLLLTYPFLEIFNRDVLVAGIPLLPLYLFGIWLVAIVALYLLGRWLDLSR
jgi:phosphotransferase system  glucose/maltose/N-acetylglucosamine-specific IIC component